MVLPMLVKTCLVLGPLLQASLSIGQDLQCWIFWALPSSCSIWPSSAGTWSFSGKLVLWPCPGNPGSTSIDRCCFVQQKTPFWGWWLLLQLGWLLLYHRLGWKAFLLLEFMLSSFKPIELLVTPRAMLPLSSLAGPWWSWARFSLLLPSVHWLEDVLGLSICSWCPGLRKTTWMRDCRTDDHCLRWSSLGS